MKAIFRINARRIASVVTAAVLLGVLFTSCTKEIGQSFKDYKERESQFIESFIVKNKLEILKKYPVSGIFEDNQFVLLENGCYLQVIDSGNGNRATPEKTTVLLKCRAVNMLNEETFNAENQIKFTFGKVSDAIKEWHYESDSPEYLILSRGIESALNFVGENAKVKMIIPFSPYPEPTGYVLFDPVYMGSSYQVRNYVPFYFDEILFQFENR